MKKIIDNLLYDTANATLIDEWHDSYYNLFNSYNLITRLCVTKNDRFFLYTYKSVLVFLFYDTEEDIKALSKKEAFEFMKKYCPEKIEYYFKIEEA